MKFSRIPLLLALLHTPHRAQCKQPSAPSAIPAPLRPLPWAQLNFLHTTDTHGWHSGHLQEPQYSADWGDYISFVQHLRARADAEGTDLLLIDTGDRVEGSGLYDGSTPPGKWDNQVVGRIRDVGGWDVVTVGNHELYIDSTSKREYDEVVPRFREGYLASNVDIFDPETNSYVPFAARYKKFKTKNQGISILAFGFLFDFTGNANSTLVHEVAETVKEQWFQDAVRQDDVDVFLVAGHVPVRDSPEFDEVYRAIRKVRWDTPVVFFGGHTHVRDYRVWDQKAQGMESGRYMETIGFLSIDGLNASGGDQNDEVEAMKKAPKYERLYIDNNLHSYQKHTGTNSTTFPTNLGENTTSYITRARNELDLDKTYACAPHSYYLTRAPYPSNTSLLSLLADHILPYTFTTPNSTEEPKIVISNSGALRFDIFEGQVTKDSLYLLSPFLSGFREIRDVPREVTAKVLELLNDAGPISLWELASDAGWSEREMSELSVHSPGARQGLNSKGSDQSLFSSRGKQQQVPLSSEHDHDGGEDNDEEELVPGYTTHDDLGDEGDDTIHKPIKFYNVPNCVSANIGFSGDDNGEDLPETIDLVFNEFIQSWVLLALRFLGLDYGSEDTRAALEGRSMTSAIREWVSVHWECEDNDDDVISGPYRL